MGFSLNMTAGGLIFSEIKSRKDRGPKFYRKIGIQTAY